jgi:hypothetical protein
MACECQQFQSARKENQEKGVEVNSGLPGAVVVYAHGKYSVVKVPWVKKMIHLPLFSKYPIFRLR